MSNKIAKMASTGVKHGEMYCLQGKRMSSANTQADASHQSLVTQGVPVNEATVIGVFHR